MEWKSRKHLEEAKCRSSTITITAEEILAEESRSWRMRMTNSCYSSTKKPVIRLTIKTNNP